MQSQPLGTCSHCTAKFEYELIHNGFNDSCFAYCDSCGTAGFMSAWRSDIPAEAVFRAHGPVSIETEHLLAACECGGRFRISAAPRCPSCRMELDAQASASWIEKNAPGTSKGWAWQRSWQGLYALVVGGDSTELQWAKLP